MDDDFDSPLLTLTVDAAQAGNRLDRWLAQSCPDLSRSRLQALIEAGCLEDQNGPVRSASRKTRPGEMFTLTLPPAEAPDPQPQDIPLTVVYEDDHLIVIDKPAGMVVHPAAGNYDGTLVNALLHHCAGSLSGIGGVKRPGIVHRIDKDTSGLLVVAKSDAAHQGLAAQFADHSIRRAYQAVVWGLPLPPAGQVEAPLGRSPQDRKKMAIVKAGGKYALTRYRTLRGFKTAAALIECRLATGRTHQIRVHMTALGHPLIGDPVYGRSRPHSLRSLPPETQAAILAFNRQALHACELGFTHPISLKLLEFQSNLPGDITALLGSLEEI